MTMKLSTILKVDHELSERSLFVLNCSFPAVFSLAKLMNVDEDPSHLSAIARYICSGHSCIIIRYSDMYF